MLHQEHLMDPNRARASVRTAFIRCSAITLLAIAASACLAQDDTSGDAQDAITIGRTGTGTGDVSHYSCVWPMCGGVEIRFDARELWLRSCVFDARANVLECDAHAADSPSMPGAFWNASAAQLSCADRLRFSCTGSTDLQACVCTSSTADATYGPVLKVKPKG
jgi:hypothetical protein